MKLAPIYPPYCEELISETGYYLCFAELCQASEAYRTFYRQQVEAGATVLMDNMIYEAHLGYSLFPRLTLDEILVQREAVGAIMVAPDVITNALETVRTFNELRQVVAPNWLAGVVQGRTYSEMEDCADSMLGKATVLCLPKIPFVKAGVARADFVRKYTRLRPTHTREMNFHLLGMSDDMGDELDLASNRHVLGVDTATPVYMGLKGVWLTGSHMLESGGKRPADYWSITAEAVAEAKTVIDYNVINLGALIGGQA